MAVENCSNGGGGAEVEVLQTATKYFSQNKLHSIYNHHTSKTEKRAFVKNDDDNYDDYDGKNAHFFKEVSVG